MRRNWLSSLLLVAAATAAPGPPPPGKLIAVRGHKLHLFCEGAGEPAVILHPGAGEFSFKWARVQDSLAKVTRVCSWDRAGYAWSDMSPDFERFGPTADDLHDLLAAARVAPPYILVGHAFGALYIRDYQRRYPGDVTGLVLVDPTPEEDNQAKMFGNTISLIDMADHDLAAWPLRPFAPSRSTPPPVPQAGRNWALDRFFEELSALTPAESLAIMESQRSTFIELYNARHNPQTALGDLPVVVLTRGRDITPEIREMQDQLNRLSRHTTHIVAEKSGSQIQLEDPQLVVDAIRRMAGR